MLPLLIINVTIAAYHILGVCGYAAELNPQTPSFISLMFGNFYHLGTTHLLMNIAALDFMYWARPVKNPWFAGRDAWIFLTCFFLCNIVINLLESFDFAGKHWDRFSGISGVNYFAYFYIAVLWLRLDVVFGMLGFLCGVALVLLSFTHPNMFGNLSGGESVATESHAYGAVLGIFAGTFIGFWLPKLQKARDNAKDK